jgi:hypothetical protein
MESEQAGGEAACFLSELDERGDVPDLRHIVRADSPGAGSREPAWRVLVSSHPTDAQSYDYWSSELAPREGETLAEYRARLEEPPCRTEAWRIALRAEETPVRIVTAPSEEGCFAEVLVSYLRELLA